MEPTQALYNASLRYMPRPWTHLAVTGHPWSRSPCSRSSGATTGWRPSRN